jgi:hypothetical protein
MGGWAWAMCGDYWKFHMQHQEKHFQWLFLSKSNILNSRPMSHHHILILDRNKFSCMDILLLGIQERMVN